MTQCGARIKARRELLGMSQTQLASAIHMDNSMISKLEAGKAQPSLKALAKLASVLGVSVADLLTDDESLTVVQRGSA